MPQSCRRLLELRNSLCGCLKVVFFCTYGHARMATHVRTRTYGHARAKERPVWLLFLARGLKVFLFIFCTYSHARTATHVRARESEGTACVVVVSGTRFEFFIFFCTYGHALTSNNNKKRILRYCVAGGSKSLG